MTNYLFLICVNWQVTTMKAILGINIPSVSQVTGVNLAWFSQTLNSENMLYLAGRNTRKDYFSPFSFFSSLKAQFN